MWQGLSVGGRERPDARRRRQEGARYAGGADFGALINTTVYRALVFRAGPLAF
jgi:hypothetical protein